MLRNHQFAFEDAEPIGQSAMGARTPLRSGAAFNALRSELNFGPASQASNLPSISAPTGVRDAPGLAETASVGAPALSPIVNTLRSEPAPFPALVADPAPMTMTAAPVAAPVTNPFPTAAAPNSGASARRFSDFLAVNPQFGGGSAADLIAGYQQWIGQGSAFTVPQSQPSTPSLAGAVGSPAPMAPPPMNQLQNFYETHGFYPGQGGQ